MVRRPTASYGRRLLAMAGRHASSLLIALGSWACWLTLPAVLAVCRPAPLLPVPTCVTAGTVLDTMPGFFPSWVFACNRLGLSITEEEFYGFAGQPMPDIIAQVRFRHAIFFLPLNLKNIRVVYTKMGSGRARGVLTRRERFCAQLHRNAGKGEMPDDYVQEFYKHKSEGMAEAHPDGFYPAPIDCVVELMKGFIARGVPVACATSGLREHVNEHMSHAGLLVCKTPAFFPTSSEKRSVCQDRLGTNTRNLNKRRGFRRSCAPTNGSWWRLTSRPAAGSRNPTSS